LRFLYAMNWIKVLNKVRSNNYADAAAGMEWSDHKKEKPQQVMLRF
jgi:hypothetical protein